MKIIREDIETSYRERINEAFNKLEVLVQKREVRKSDIIEHPKYVKELLRYMITDLQDFRDIQGDQSLGGMIICETSDQARNLFKYFNEIQDKQWIGRRGNYCRHAKGNHQHQNIQTHI